MTITLKIPSYDDYEHIYNARFQPEVVYWADDMAHEMSLDEYATTRIFSQSQGFMFERIIMHDGEAIGTITGRDFEPSNKQCTLGIVIAFQKDWGHGYGTEALKQFLPMLKEEGVEIVVLDTYSANKRAQNCFKRLGFSKHRVYYAPNTGRFVVQMVKRLVHKNKV